MQQQFYIRTTFKVYLNVCDSITTTVQDTTKFQKQHASSFLMIDRWVSRCQAVGVEVLGGRLV